VGIRRVVLGKLIENSLQGGKTNGAILLSTVFWTVYIVLSSSFGSIETAFSLLRAVFSNTFFNLVKIYFMKIFHISIRAFMSFLD
jgi:hypothetical protein